VLPQKSRRESASFPSRASPALESRASSTTLPMPCEARHRLGDVSKAVGCRIPTALLCVGCALRTSGIGAAIIRSIRKNWISLLAVSFVLTAQGA
jgi:hypothetical protein